MNVPENNSKNNYEEINSQNENQKKLKIKKILIIIKLLNQLLFTFLYYTISLLNVYGLFYKNFIKIRSFLQIWLALYSLVFVIVGIITIKKLNSYQDKTLDKITNIVDVSSTTLDALYFICELLIAIEIIRHFYFGKAIKNAKFSIYEIVCIVIFSILTIFSFFYLANSTLTLYEKNEVKINKKSLQIDFAKSIMNTFGIILTLVGYIVCNLENRNVINTNAEIKLIGTYLMIFSALIGSVVAILSVYDEFRDKKYDNLQDYDYLEKNKFDFNSIQSDEKVQK